MQNVQVPAFCTAAHEIYEATTIWVTAKMAIASALREHREQQLASAWSRACAEIAKSLALKARRIKQKQQQKNTLAVGRTHAHFERCERVPVRHNVVRLDRDRTMIVRVPPSICIRNHDMAWTVLGKADTSALAYCTFARSIRSSTDTKDRRAFSVLYDKVAKLNLKNETLVLGIGIRHPTTSSALKRLRREFTTGYMSLARYLPPELHDTFPRCPGTTLMFCVYRRELYTNECLSCKRIKPAAALRCDECGFRGERRKRPRDV